MQLIHQLGRVGLYMISALGYVACGAILFGIAIAIKIIALTLAHRYLYPIFIFGDLLRGLELIDLLNLLVFAVVGMGFGLATALLPSQAGRKISAAFLVILVPLILAIPQYVRYNLWIEDISTEDQISQSAAISLGDSFLESRVNHPGVFGFYLYTGQFPMIPTKASQMEDLTKLEKQVNSRFVKVSGIPPTVVTWLMGICFWGIRIFYFCVAVVTTVAHFKDGLKIVGRY
ncbi:MAG: hypothetical protein WAN66_18660 [Limnoraphis robusta]|uniref:Uncharacterized protein n=1 Tax=Limnoraphis robusta CCNP1315 TaxID=3110306 RepID=A0ABU5U6L8_9CYAN|nr:hypothetical protein [Limnoraphis robusta]MEA5522507.1 hypothetical protein [Limnoraphis robusta CCNP1315]MEA5548250.1 hypothetical protein [Limnoraphis robusta CCNP1324]